MKIEWLSGKKNHLILSCILWILLDFLIPYMYQWDIDADTFTHKSLFFFLKKRWNYRQYVYARTTVQHYKCILKNSFLIVDVKVETQCVFFCTLKS